MQPSCHAALSPVSNGIDKVKVLLTHRVTHSVKGEDIEGVVSAGNSVEEFLSWVIVLEQLHLVALLSLPPATHHQFVSQPIISLSTNPSSAHHPTHSQLVNQPIISLSTNPSSASQPTHHQLVNQPIINLSTNPSSACQPAHHQLVNQPIISLSTSPSACQPTNHQLVNQAIIS